MIDNFHNINILGFFRIICFVSSSISIFCSSCKFVYFFRVFFVSVDGLGIDCSPLRFVESSPNLKCLNAMAAPIVKRWFFSFRNFSRLKRIYNNTNRKRIIYIFRCKIFSNIIFVLFLFLNKLWKFSFSISAKFLLKFIYLIIFLILSLSLSLSRTLAHSIEYLGFTNIKWIFLFVSYLVRSMFILFLVNT